MGLDLNRFLAIRFYVSWISNLVSQNHQLSFRYLHPISGFCSFQLLLRPVKNRRTVMPFNCFRAYIYQSDIVTDCEGLNYLSEMCPVGVIAQNSPELVVIQSVWGGNQLFKRCDSNFVPSAQICVCFSKVRSELSLKAKLRQNFPLSTNLFHILNTFHAWHFNWHR